MKRLLSILLVAVMCFSLIPATVFAEDLLTQEESAQGIQEESVQGIQKEITNAGTTEAPENEANSGVLNSSEARFYYKNYVGAEDEFTEASLDCGSGFGVLFYFKNEAGEETGLTLSDLTFTDGLHLYESSEGFISVLCDNKLGTEYISYTHEGTEYQIPVYISLPQYAFYSAAQRDTEHYLSNTITVAGETTVYLMWDASCSAPVAVSLQEWDSEAENWKDIEATGELALGEKDTANRCIPVTLNITGDRQIVVSNEDGTCSTGYLRYSEPHTGFYYKEYAESDKIYKEIDAEFGYGYIELFYFTDDNGVETALTVNDLVFTDGLYADVDTEGNITIWCDINLGTEYISYFHEGTEYKIPVNISLPVYAFYSAPQRDLDHYLSESIIITEEKTVYLMWDESCPAPADIYLERWDSEAEDWAKVEAAGELVLGEKNTENHYIPVTLNITEDGFIVVSDENGPWLSKYLHYSEPRNGFYCKYSPESEYFYKEIDAEYGTGIYEAFYFTDENGVETALTLSDLTFTDGLWADETSEGDVILYCDKNVGTEYVSYTYKGTTYKIPVYISLPWYALYSAPQRDTEHLLQYSLTVAGETTAYLMWDENGSEPTDVFLQEWDSETHSYKKVEAAGELVVGEKDTANHCIPVTLNITEDRYLVVSNEYDSEAYSCQLRCRTGFYYKYDPEIDDFSKELYANYGESYWRLFYFMDENGVETALTLSDLTFSDGLRAEEDTEYGGIVVYCDKNLGTEYISYKHNGTEYKIPVEITYPAYGVYTSPQRSTDTLRSIVEVNSDNLRTVLYILWDEGLYAPDVYLAEYDEENNELVKSMAVGELTVNETDTEACRMKITLVPTKSKYLVIDGGSDSNVCYIYYSDIWQIHYELNGGDIAVGNPTAYNTPNGAILHGATRTGYTFAGWYADAKLKKLVTEIPAGTEGDITLYAKWTPNTYQIAFAPNGGTGTMKNLKVTYDKATALTSGSFKRTGYVFSGWALTEDGAVEYVNKEKVLNLAEKGTVTLYAVWSPINYSVVYNGNKGTYLPAGAKKAVSSVTVAGYEYDKPEALKENVFTRTGYTFTGWNTKAAGTGNGLMEADNLVSTANGKYTVYAQWAANSYTIFFDGNGAAYEADPIETVYDKSVKLPKAAPVRSGYTFLGWSTDPAAVKAAYKAGASVKNLSAQDRSSVTLYAVWSPNTYTVTFNYNGGKVNAADKAAFNKQTIVMDKTTAKVPTAEPYFTKYTFAGWNTAKNGTGSWYYGGQTIAVADYPAKNKGTLTLYAIWTYTVTYNPGTGEGSAFTDTLYYNVSGTQNAPSFHKNGYYLAGWALTEANAAKGSVKYKVNAVKNAGDGTVLYAVWKANTYTVTYDSNNGTGKAKTQKLTWDKTAALTANSFKTTGKTFLGWSLTPDGAVNYTNKQKVTNIPDGIYQGTITLYAIWQ